MAWARQCGVTVPRASAARAEPRGSGTARSRRAGIAVLIASRMKRRGIRLPLFLVGSDAAFDGRGLEERTKANPSKAEMYDD